MLTALLPTWTRRFSRPLLDVMRLGRIGMITLAICMAAGCHGLMDVTDPTVVRDQDIANADGALGRLRVAYNTFNGYVSPKVRDVALFSDELSYDVALQQAVPSDEFLLDQRNSAGYEGIHLSDDPHLGPLDQIVTSTSLAIPAVRQYSPDSLRGDYLAQLFMYRAYALIQMAEDLCPGFPINDITADHQLILSGPYTNDSVFVLAVQAADSAIADAVDSTTHLNAARILKGRALLTLGRYAEAATAVAQVPSNFTFATDRAYSNYLYNANEGNDPTWSLAGYPVGDHEWGTGLAFVSEHDPRVPTTYIRQGFNDATIAEYAEAKYTDVTPTIVASGVEARLIEAEAALAANDPNWLTILNTLRGTVGLSPIADPGTAAVRVDFLYHERAFWLFLTGHRLGDLHRLIRNYGRSASTVFPAGANPFLPNGGYQAATAIPFSLANEAEYNPKITTGCTVR